MRDVTKAILFVGFMVFSSGTCVVAQEASAPGGVDLVQVLKDEGRVVAKVNGHEITAQEIALAADDILPQLPNIPPQLRYPFIVEYLIERHLLAQAAVKDGIPDGEEYKKRLAFYQAKALRDAYFTEKLKPMVSDEEIKQAYDREAKKVREESRARARHILVASEKEAQAIEQRLKKGEKFEDIARQVNLDGSKAYGGDLGYFTASEMVPEFSNAVFSMKVGAVSPPVKTDRGWHIIKVEDFKKGEPQPFDQVKDAIKLVLLRQKVQDKLIALRGESEISILDPDLKKLQEQAEKKREEIRKSQEDSGEGAGAE